MFITVIIVDRNSYANITWEIFTINFYILAKPKPSSTKLPLTPTTSFMPPELAFPSTPPSVAYTLRVPPPVDVKQQEKERSDGNKELEKNIGLIMAVSALAVFIAIACGVALLLVIRKNRSRHGRRPNRMNEEERITLQEISARNDEEDRLNEENDAGEQHIQEQPGHDEQRHYDEVLQADSENQVQETQTPRPIQATPSERNICG